MLILCLSFLFVVNIYPSNTGYILYGSDGFESHISIDLGPDIHNHTEYIEFETYRPDKCREGILILSDSEPVDFVTTNETYENGTCRSATVIFRNHIYEPPTETEIPDNTTDTTNITNTTPENTTIQIPINDSIVLPIENATEPIDNETISNQTISIPSNITHPENDTTLIPISDNITSPINTTIILPVNTTINESVEIPADNDNISDILLQQPEPSENTTDIDPITVDSVGTNQTQGNIITGNAIASLLPSDNPKKQTYHIYYGRIPQPQDETPIELTTLSEIQDPAEIGKPVIWTRIIEATNNNTEETDLELEIDIQKSATYIEVLEKSSPDPLKVEKKEGILSMLSISESDNLDTEKYSVKDKLNPKETRLYKVMYYTPAPEKNESEPIKTKDTWKKTITISSDYNIHYQNILSYTDIEESKENDIRLYHYIDGEKTDITKNQLYRITFLDTNNNGLIDKIEWITPHTSQETFEVEVTLTILNIQSYPVVGGNWTVMFNTTGIADLTIRPVNGTAWSEKKDTEDLRFIELRCGDNPVAYKWVNDQLTVKGFECSETAYEISHVITSGKHHLEFTFGTITEYAHNDASIPISTCGTLATANGYYILTADIFDFSSSKCMEVTEDNITIDCQGHTIDGISANEGISRKGGAAIKTNTTVINCTIKEWQYGVYMEGDDGAGGEYVTLYNNTIIDNDYGVYLKRKIANSTIQMNNISSNNYGIYMNSARDGNLIFNNYLNNINNYYPDSNNYLNTTLQSGTRIYSEGPMIGGNYYSNSTGGYSDICVDSNHDGFCDSPYTLASGNIDYLSLSDEYMNFTVTLSSPADDSWTADTTPDFSFIPAGSETSYYCSLYIDGTEYNSTNLVNVGHIDNGGSAYGVWSDGEYIYLANNDDGLRAYTFDGSSFVNVGNIAVGSNALDVWGDGSYIYVGSAFYDIYAYTFNGSDFVNLDSVPSGASNAVWSDGDYIYNALNDFGVRAHTFDGNSFANAGLLDYDGYASAYDVWGDGDYIYVAKYSGGLYAHSFNGSDFEELGNINDGGWPLGIWGDGDYIYLANKADGLRAYTFGGSSFVNVGHIDDGGNAYDVIGDGDYIYLANDVDGLRAYTFNGSSFVNVGNIDNGGNAYDVWVDGDYVYLANYGDGLRAYTFGESNNTLATFTTTALSEGTYEWYVNCSKGGVTVSSGTRTMSVDITPPQVTIESPINTTYSTDYVDFNYTAVDANIGTCLYSINGAANITLPSCQNTTLVSLDDGIHTLVLYANDTAGNTASAIIYFTYDSSSPVVTLITPIADYSTTGTTQDFTFNVTDNLNTSMSCSLYINDTLIATNATTANATTTTFESIPISHETGQNWTVNCSDGINTHKPEARIFNIDTQSPRYSANSTNSSAKGASIQFLVRWTDNNGLSGHIFSFDNGTGDFTNSTWTSMSGTQDYTNVTLIVNATLNTTIRWKVYANDTAGNWNISETYSFITKTRKIVAFKRHETRIGTVGDHIENSGWWGGQSFEANASNLKRIGIYTKNSDEDDPLTIEIYRADGSGLPYGNPLRSVNISHLNITSLSYYHYLDLEPAQSLNITEKYAIIFKGYDSTDGGYYVIYLDDENDYTEGSYIYSDDQGSSWNAAPYDALFRLYYETYDFPKTYYVDKDHLNAADSNEGTDSEYPLETIARSMDLASAGDTVIVKDGVYNETGDLVNTYKTGELIDAELTPLNPGTPQDRMLIKSENIGGAIIDNTHTGQGILVQGTGYTTIDGFTIRNIYNVGVANIYYGSDYNIYQRLTVYNLTGPENSIGMLMGEQYDGGPWKIYSCMIYSIGDENDAYGISSYGDYSWSEIKNCIIKNTTSNGIYVGSEPDLDYTLLYNADGLESSPYAGGVTPGSHMIYVDPAFVDEPGYDFDLSASSPAIDNGTDVGLEYNGTAPDLGALESPYSIHEIDSCTDLNETYGIYRLTTDILDSEYDKCINITADSITLDCQGNTIDGQDIQGSYGIYVSRASYTETDISLKNCIITDWRKGIYLENSGKNSITNISSNSNLWHGIELYSSKYNNVTNNTLQENGFYDLKVSPSSESDCDNSIMNNTGSGGDSIVYYNYTVSIAGNAYSQVILCDADNSSIDSITVDGSSSLHNNGIYLSYTENTTISNSDSSENHIALRLEYSSDNLVANNTLHSNQYDGVYMYVSSGNNITNNTISDNSNSGIYLFSSGASGPNRIYNNLLNNTDNIEYYASIYENYWNTTQNAGTRVYSDGNQLSGNYYTNSTENDYSDTCADTNHDGFCDDAYNIETDNIDYHPLSDEYDPTYISSCQSLDEPNANYHLTSNVSSEGTCFTIAADNITLDGQGYTINYSQSEAGYAIDDNGGYDNITITNCTIVQGSTSSSSYAIYYQDTTEGKVIDSTITTQGTQSHGIYIKDTETLNITGNTINTTNAYPVYIYPTDTSSYYNHTIDTTNTEDGEPIYYYYNIEDQKIEDLEDIGFLYVTSSNNITIENITADKDSIILADTENSSISNCTMTITDSYTSAIYIDSYSHNSNASFNTVQASGTHGYGIRVGTATGCNIASNTISTSGQDGYGISVYGATDTILDNNTISNSGRWGYGIMSQLLSTGTRYYNNTIQNTGLTATCYQIVDTYNGIFQNNNCTSALGGGMTLSYSYGNIIYDDVLTSIGVYGGNSDNNLVNVTFSSINVDNGKIYIQYYLDTYVNKTDGTPIEYATVTATQVNGSEEFEATTDSNGNIERQILTEYMQNSTGKYYYTNYTVEASYLGSTGTEDVNLTESKSLIFTLDIIPLSISISAPQNSTYSSDYVYLNITTSRDAEWCAYDLDDTGNTTMTGESTDWDSRISSLSEGPHSLDVYCNDTAGNIAQSLISFTIDSSLCYPPFNDSWIINQTLYCTGNNVTSMPNLTIGSNGSVTFDSSDLDIFKTQINSDGEFTITNSITELRLSNNLTVDGNLYVVSSDILLNGYMNINDNATLYNMTLRMNSTETISDIGYFNINIVDGAYFNTDHVKITLGETSGIYWGRIKDYGTMTMNYTRVEYTSGGNAGGVSISTTASLTRIYNTIFYDDSANTIFRIADGLVEAHNLTSGESASYAIDCRSSDGVYIYDSDFKATSGVGYGGKLYIINSSMLNTWHGTGSGQIYRQWYVDVNISDYYNNQISSANVSFYNYTDYMETSNLTDNDGYKRFIITEYHQSSGGGLNVPKNYTTPHSVNATKSGYISNSTIINLTETHSTSVSLMLDINTSLSTCIELTKPDTTYTLMNNVSSTGTCFTISAENITLDGNGYTVTYTQSELGYGVWINTPNATLKNLNINAASDTQNSHGIYVTEDNNTIIDNNVTVPGRAVSPGFTLSADTDRNYVARNYLATGNNYVAMNMNYIHDSQYINNTINGLVYISSYTAGNTFSGNNFSSKFLMGSVYVMNNNVIGGSIGSYSTSGYIPSLSSGNTFRNTNFVGAKTIYFDSNTYIPYFNYNNETDGDIWLNTSVSEDTTLTRTLVTWSESNMQWNDTNSTSGRITTYDLTGLTPSTIYTVQNTSSTGTTTRDLTTDSAGNLESFNIDLMGNTQINIFTASDPTLTVDTPTTNSYLNYAPSLNGTCTDTGGISQIWTNASEYDTPDTDDSPFNFTNTSELTEGIYYINISCNDTAGNIVSTIITFTYDATEPYITFVDPTPENTTYRNQNHTNINVTTTDTLSNDNLTAFIDWNNSLIGWWRFNNEDGENSTYFRDWSRTMSNGTCSGTNCSTYTNSKFGNALKYDGIDDFVNIPYNSVYNLATSQKPMTLELWFRLDTVPSSTTDLLYRLQYYRLYISSQKFGGLLWNGAGLQYSQTLQKDTWYHGTFIWNGTAVKIYLNGNYGGSSTGVGSYGGSPPIYIGYSGQFDTHINGTIDEVKIWNRALSESEINASYNSGLYRLETNFTNLTDGEYTYTAYVQDLAGNVNNTETRTLTVDTTAPTVTLDSPADNAIQSPGTIEIKYTPSDNIALDNCSIWTNTTGTWSLNATDDIPEDSVQNTTELTIADSVYIWNVECYDEAGNSAFNETNRTFTIQTPDYCDPSTMGTWIITESVTCDQKNIVTTKDLTIGSGATVTFTSSNITLGSLNILDGATLTFSDSPHSVIHNSNFTIEGTVYINNTKHHLNGSYDGDVGINVTSTGALYILNGSNITNGVGVDGGVLDANFFFTVEDGATFQINDSSVSYAGFGSSWTDEKDRGLWIATDNVVIKNTTITDSYTGLSLFGVDNSQIYGNMIESCLSYAIYLYEYESDSPEGNKIYNNYFGSQSTSMGISGTLGSNSWNTTIQSGDRIYGSGSQISGNYYTSTGTPGYSDTCEDLLIVGFCDVDFTIASGNVDYNALTNGVSAIIMTMNGSLSAVNFTFDNIYQTEYPNNVLEEWYEDTEYIKIYAFANVTSAKFKTRSYMYNDSYPETLSLDIGIDGDYEFWGTGYYEGEVFRLDYFNDSTTDENITFVFSDSEIYYLKLPKNISLISATIDLKAYTGGGFSEDGTGNAVVNGDFEAGSWTGWENHGPSLRTDIVHSGTYSARFYSTKVENDYDAIGQTISSLINDDKYVTLWYYPVDLTPDYINMPSFDNSKTAYSTDINGGIRLWSSSLSLYAEDSYPYAAVSNPFPETRWYKIQILCQPSLGKSTLWIDGEYKASITNNPYTETGVYMWIGDSWWGTIGEIEAYVDDIIVNTQEILFNPNVSISIGDDSDIEWGFYSINESNSTITVDLPETEFAEHILSCASADVGDGRYYCDILFNITSLEAGIVSFNNTNITYHYSEAYYEDGIYVDYKDEIKEYLNHCNPDENYFCYVPVTMFSDAQGIVDLYDINITYTIDLNRTFLTIYDPIESGYIYDAVYDYAPEISGECISYDGISYIWTDVSQYSDYETESPFDLANTSSLSESLYYMNVSCNSTYGVTVTKPAPFVYDLNAPVLVDSKTYLEYPTSKMDLKLWIEAYDNLVIPLESYVQFYVNDAPYGSVIKTDIFNGSWAYAGTLDNTSFNDGDTVIAEVWVSDRANNSTKQNITIYIEDDFNVDLNIDDEHAFQSSTVILNYTVTGPHDDYYCWLVVDGSVNTKENIARLDNMDEGGTAYSVFGDDDYIYLANYDDGLRAYSFDGDDLDNISHVDDGGYAYDVYASGGYIYLANLDDGLRAYTFDGNSFTDVGHVYDGVNVSKVFAEGTYIYSIDTALDLTVYTFNGSDFTERYNMTSSFRDVWSDGKYIYGAMSYGLDVYLINGTDIDFIDGDYTYTNHYDIWGDGQYIYVASYTDGLRAYSFDGEELEYLGGIDNGAYAYGVFGDGNYVYLANDYSGIWVYKFDGSAFTQIGYIDNGGNAKAVWSDGDYIYLANYGYGIYAYSFGSKNTTLDSLTTTLSEAEHNWSVNCSYDGIYSISEVRDFVIDLTPPTITIESPENISYSDSNIWINVSIDEDSSWCGYSLNSESNVSMTMYNSTYFYYLLTGPKPNGSVLDIYCNDTQGLFSSESISFVYYNIDFIQNSTNSTKAGLPVEHSLNVRSFNSLSDYIFLFYNGSNRSYESVSDLLTVTESFVFSPENITESFEDGFPPEGWSVGGNANWVSTSSTYQDGSYSAASGDISDSQTSWIEVEKVFSSGGGVRFYWSVSSESNYDYLLYCGTNTACTRTSGYVSRIAGTVSWTQASYMDSYYGDTTLHWAYAKDSSASSGSDLGWIDHVEFINVVNPVTDGDTDEVVYDYDQYNEYLAIDNITITLNIVDYNDSASSHQSSADPDLALMMYNGTDMRFVDNFSISSTGNVSITVTDSDILDAWLDWENHTFSVFGTAFDYNLSGYYDKIDYSDLWVSIYGVVDYVPDELIGFDSPDCNANHTDCWVNVTKVINSTVGSTIMWKVYADDITGNYNVSEVYSYETIDPILRVLFVDPTPNDGSITNNDYAYINVTTTDALSGDNLTAFIDWNNSLVGWWRLNNNTGTYVKDYSTYGNDGNMVNMSIGLDNGTSGWATSGKFGNAVEFDGTNDYINCGNTNSLNSPVITDEVTMEAWIYVKDSEMDDFSSVISNYNMYHMTITDNKLGYRYRGSAAGSEYITSLSDLLHSWHHIAITFKGNDQIKYYVDSNLTFNETAGTLVGSQTNMNTLIGRYVDTYDAYFNGTIDEVKIWNRALSWSEINASYNSGLYRLENNFTDLAEGEYTYTAYVQDLSGNVNNTEPRTLTIDTLAPAVTLDSPEDNALLSSGTVSIKHTPSDNIALENCSIWTNSTGVWSLNSTDDTPQSGVQNTTELTLSDGFYIWNVECFDGAGNSAFNDTNSSFIISISTSDLRITKHFTPDTVMVQSEEIINVTTTVQLNETVDDITTINITDDIPYDFTAPELENIRINFIDYSNSNEKTDITAGSTISITDRPEEQNTIINITIANVTESGAPTYLQENDSIEITYQMTSSRLNSGDTRSTNTTAYIPTKTSSKTTSISASESVLRAYKEIWHRDPAVPANISVRITLQSLGGAVSEILIADYLPEGAIITETEVTYHNNTMDTDSQLEEDLDYNLGDPYNDILDDGNFVEIYNYNFSYAYTNWDGTLYENDTITIEYNVTVLGGGSWTLPVIIGAFDPAEQKFLKTEMYTTTDVPSFDVLLEILTDDVEVGDTAIALLRILNVGGPRAKVDVFIVYAIKDFDGTIITEKSETIAVVESKEKKLELDIPEKTRTGTYSFESYVTYTGREALSTGTIEIEGKPEDTLMSRYGDYIIISFMFSMFTIILMLLINRASGKNKS